MILPRNKERSEWFTWFWQSRYKLGLTFEATCRNTWLGIDIFKWAPWQTKETIRGIWFKNGKAIIFNDLKIAILFSTIKFFTPPPLPNTYLTFEQCLSQNKKQGKGKHMFQNKAQSSQQTKYKEDAA